MHIKLIPIAVAAVAIAAAGCGRSDSDDDAAAAPLATAAPVATTAPAAAPTTAESPPGGAIAAKVGESDLGELLASTEGLTLYGFTNDVDASSTCYGTCADAWPPVIVDADWTVGPGLDTGIFATTERDDGTLQLVAGRWPLYTYSGDAAPGDTTGQGSGEVWFVVGTGGSLVTDATDGADSDAAAPETTAASDTTAPAPETTAPAPAVDPYAVDNDPYAVDDAPASDTPALVSVAATGLGDALVDANGLTLYGFTNDSDGVPTCEGDCAGAWPPVLVDGQELPAGLDPAVFTVVDRPDGTHQLKAGAWPLYRFAGDANPGETNGQGSGDVWFVVDPAGGLIK